MQENTSGCSSGKAIRRPLKGSSVWAREHAVAKKGEAQRISLWAAKSRLSGPTQMVITDEDRELCHKKSVSPKEER